MFLLNTRCRCCSSGAEVLSGTLVKLDPLLPEAANILIQSLAAPINQPFSLELWSTNPAELLAQITVLVLIVIGKKDIQVVWQAGRGALETAAVGHGNVTFVYPDTADHVLKDESTPKDSINAAETAVRYNADDRTLDPEVEKVIKE
jgi:hypothetical protein